MVLEDITIYPYQSVDIPCKGFLILYKDNAGYTKYTFDGGYTTYMYIYTFIQCLVLMCSIYTLARLHTAFYHLPKLLYACLYF